MSEPKANPSPTKEVELSPILAPAPDSTAENEARMPSPLVRIDESIVSTALPTIAAESKSSQDIGAYGSAFLLPQAVLQPFFGKLYAALEDVESRTVGSVITASAQTSSTLIGGRALSSIGAVGLTNVLVAITSAVISISSVLRPLVRGVLVDGPGWRWCFWINLRIGGAVILLLFASMMFPMPKTPERSKSLREKLMHLDLLGTGLFALCLISLLLALQYGVDRPWNDPLIIAFLVVSAAALPAVQGLSARDSGFRTIAYVVSSAVGVGIAAAVMTKLSYLNPLLIPGSSIFWISTGLFTTFDVGSSTPYIVGIQVLAGVGVGLCVLCQTVCLRLVLSKQDIHLCHSVTLMLQVLARLPTSHSATSSPRTSSAYTYPDVQRAALGGIEHIHQNISAENASKIVDALSDAFRKAFNIGIATAAVAWVFLLCVEWRLLEGKEKKIEPRSDAVSTS
ncbi:major facilitator superfamily domain-containing protein [Phaeosphaeriaceae sp. PMI808]|nr:major facilitator superfamily domain-containing protein [Phaeosphaeriaceae sp. PMI808]